MRLHKMRGVAVGSIVSLWSGELPCLIGPLGRGAITTVVVTPVLRSPIPKRLAAFGSRMHKSDVLRVGCVKVKAVARVT